MSYDLDYKDNKGNLFDLGEVMEEGGTYAVGNTKTTLNITYISSWYYSCSLSFDHPNLSGFFTRAGLDHIKVNTKSNIEIFTGF